MVRLMNTRLSLYSKVLDKEKNIDFFDTHSLVTRILSIRVLVPLAAVHNSIVLQMDVKVVFFYGEVEEVIYMEQPEKFCDSWTRK
jgi:hypothetical protein